MPDAWSRRRSAGSRRCTRPIRRGPRHPRRHDNLTGPGREGARPCAGADAREEGAGVADHVLAIDQGTTSTRAIVFDSEGAIVSVAQREHEQIFPRAGWVEHDPVEIWTDTESVVAECLARAGAAATAIAGIGVTNQRET